MGRFLFLIIVGIGGAGILVWLGVWQVQRLEWKNGLLANIEARIADDPVTMPVELDPVADKYMPVAIEGQFADGALRILASRKQIGPVYRIVRPFLMTDGRRILIDTGWTSDQSGVPALEKKAAKLIGNLHWPNEIDSFTPDPDIAANIWFARDVSAMAIELKTQPILVVLRDEAETDFGVTPWPVATNNVPNDHLQYAITWFSLAVIWVGMSAYFMLRRARDQKETS